MFGTQQRDHPRCMKCNRTPISVQTWYGTKLRLHRCPQRQLLHVLPDYRKMLPAHVVQWISHSDATFGRAWRARSPLLEVQSELRSGKARLLTKDLFHNNSYACDDQGDNPLLASCFVMSRCWPAPTWPKQKDVTSLWLCCISVCRGQRCISNGGLSLHKFQPG